MHWPGRAALIGVCALLLALGGCAARCKRVAQLRDDIAAREATAEAPHLRVVIPHVVTQREIAKRLRRKGATKIELPSVPGVGLSLGTVRVRIDRVTMTAARPGNVGFRVRLGVLQGRRSLASLDLDAQVRPRIDVAAGTVRAALRPDDIRSVRPKLSKGSAQRLGATMHARLPSAARMLVSKEDLATFADRVLRELVSRSWPTLRRELLADLGEIASVEIDLPDLPLRGVSIRSDRAVLELAVTTTLPVAAGVERSVTPEAGDHAVIVASGEAVAELANLAMETGELPARYDEDGTPKPDGPLVPTFAWRPGKRPLKVHVFDGRDDCVYLRLGATPRATVEGHHVEVAVDDGVIEKAEGPAKLRLLAWSQRMGKNALSVTETFAGRLDLDLAGEPIRLRVRRIGQSSEQVVVGLSIGR